MASTDTILLLGVAGVVGYLVFVDPNALNSVFAMFPGAQATTTTTDPATDVPVDPAVVDPEALPPGVGDEYNEILAQLDRLQKEKDSSSSSKQDAINDPANYEALDTPAKLAAAKSSQDALALIDALNQSPQAKPPKLSKAPSRKKKKKAKRASNKAVDLVNKLAAAHPAPPRTIAKRASTKAVDLINKLAASRPAPVKKAVLRSLQLGSYYEERITVA